MNLKQHQQEMVEHYIKAYNAFDTEAMVQDLHPEVYFENSAGGEVNLETRGVEAFKIQADQAKHIFLNREQHVAGMYWEENSLIVHIKYTGTLAVDLPQGLKAGDTLQLVGKSIFEFKEGKIFHIRDES